MDWLWTPSSVSLISTTFHMNFSDYSVAIISYEMHINFRQTFLDESSWARHNLSFFSISNSYHFHKKNIRLIGKEVNNSFDFFFICREKKSHHALNSKRIFSHSHMSYQTHIQFVWYIKFIQFSYQLFIWLVGRVVFFNFISNSMK